MGQEIVYCFGCRTRLKGSEFDSTNAFLLFNKPTCRPCAVRMLPTLPPDQQQWLANILNKPPRTPAPRRTTLNEPAVKPSKKPALLIGVGVAAGAVLVLMVALASSGGGKKPGAVVQAPVEIPKPVETIPPALEKARAAGPDDRIKEYKKALWDLEGTKHYETAKQELDVLLKKRKKTLEAELAKVDEEIRDSYDSRDYRRVLELLRNARARFEDTEWAAMVDRKVADTERGLEDYFVALKDQAVKARQAGDQEKVDRLRDQVAKWGFDAYLAQFDKAMPEAQARDVIFGAGRLRGAGTFRLVDDATVGRCWTSSASTDAREARQNYVDVEFTAAANVQYRLHIFVGGCCQDSMALMMQGTDINGTDASGRQVSLEPGGGLFVRIATPNSQAPKTHSSECASAAKTWEWRSVDVRYTAAGPKKLRILTCSEGYSIALVIVTSDKYLSGPPRDMETIRRMARD